MKTRIALCCALLATLLATACGGGGGSGDVAPPADPPVAGTEVPTSATQSAAGAFSFVSTVAAARSETAEPLVVGDAALGQSETDEPEPL